MLGLWIKSKYPYSFENIGKPLDKAFNIIQLTESHEAGEIINDYYLIANENIIVDGIMKYKFEEGYYVKLIDIRYFDLFETDFNYDNRDDLTKYGVKMKTYENQIVKTNVYGYCGIDYPEGF